MPIWLQNALLDQSFGVSDTRWLKNFRKLLQVSGNSISAFGSSDSLLMKESSDLF